MAASTENLVLTLPPELGSKLRALAEAERRTPEEVVAEACRAHLDATQNGALDDRYEDGYRRVPEDDAEAEAVVRIAPLPPEDWS